MIKTVLIIAYNLFDLMYSEIWIRVFIQSRIRFSQEKVNDKEGMVKLLCQTKVSGFHIIRETIYIYIRRELTEIDGGPCLITYNH